MTRLANVERAGYYPLPSLVTEQIASHIVAPAGGRLLDPCAGEGAALVAFAERLGLEPYGVELHEQRAATARQAIADLRARRGETASAVTPLIGDSYLSLRTSRAGYNFLYLNPPYDEDEEDGRLESQWLTRCRPWLQAGGLLVWVVPQHLLRFRKATRYILSWFDRVRVYRFPDEAYERFKQIVLFGVQRERAQVASGEAVERLAQAALDKTALPPLTVAAEPAYSLPPLAVKGKAFTFRSLFIDPADALAEARQWGVGRLAAWREHLDPASVGVALQPLTPLKIGHMHNVIAAGHLNNQVLTDEETGERLLIKGRSYKTTAADQYEEALPDGRIRLTKLETESVVTDVTSLAADGRAERYSGAALERFLQRWIGRLTGIIARDYRPVYQFDLGGYGELLNRLSKQRPIPGLNGRSGLLPAQKHAAAAILTRLETASEAVAIGEMGTGKAQGLDNKVLTPTGWKRMGDIQVGDEVINPEGGTANVIGVYPQGKKKMYRVTFSDGAQTECCDEHLWLVWTPERKWRKRTPHLFELQQMRPKLFSQSNNARYFIPLVTPVEFAEKPLPLDSYLLGALLGDGGLSGASPIFTSADDEVIREVGAALPDEVSFKSRGKYDYRISGDYRSRSHGHCSSSNPVTVALRKLGLMGHRSEDKFIPKCYLFSRVPSRIALLQGLLDTDGAIGRQRGGFTGHITYSTVSEQLARDVTELVQSLGGTAKQSTRMPRYTHQGQKRRGQLAYQLHIKLPDYIRPFRLNRKLERVLPRTKYGVSRALVKIEYVGKKEAQCIALDSENQLYVTDDYIVTHNTTIGAAVAAGRHARRTIILCPPHLVDKWQREVKAVWPGVRATHLQTIADVDQFFADQPDDAPLIGVLKQTTARSASGWEHAYDYGGPASHSYSNKGYNDVQRLWGEALVARPAESEAEQVAFRRPFSGRQSDLMRQRGIRCPVCGETQFLSGRPLALQEMKTATRQCSNEACRSPLYQFTRRRSESQTRGSFKLYAARERALLQALRSPAPLLPSSPAPSPPPHLLHGYGKVPLSGYIKKRAKGKLDLLVVDEVHQYKGIDSDQGYAMHHLAQAAGRVVALTGTIYGGKASSLFHLLFRLAPEMQQAYVNPEASGQRRLRSREWVSAYGILQQIETITLDEDGRQTANSRSNIRYKELPGGSPAMLPWLLNRSVFLSLGDMGFPLPPYSEIPIAIPMAPEQAARYESLKEQLREELKERLVRGDKSLLAGYLYALLFWPDSPRRAKVVRCPRTEKIVASVPGLGEDFSGPKEEAIVELCLKEKAAGRKVLLLCQQTDTLDIQPEWKEMLGAAGLKAAILRAAPNKREGWIEQQVKAGVDVVISHPRKVETGIDLLDFPTIIWMAIDYSVYTVLQASRRSWRIGQTQPVKVYYFAYEETIQEDALRLVAAKVAAALRVNGDTVGDGGLADLDELASGDLVATLAKIITGEVQIEARSLQQAFAEANASLRQANTMIGEYGEREEDGERGRWGDGERVLLPERVGNGVARQAGLFGQGAGKANGHAPKPNGHPTPATSNQPPATSDQPPATSNQPPPAPPVPRPRLLIGQLGGRP